MNELNIIEECLLDYAGPFLVIGNIDDYVRDKNPIVISATWSKDNYCILNNRIPKWVELVMARATEANNVLIIKDFDKISLDKQEFFLDIVEDNQVSAENLPDNLKIILQADAKFSISQELRDLVELYEI